MVWLMKTCTSCSTALPEESFYKHPQGAGGRDSRCKPCVRGKKADRYYRNRAGVLEQAREYRRRNGDRLRAASAEYRRTRCPIKQKNYELVTRFGITLEDYNTKLAEQGGACAICRSTHPGRKGATHFAVDHDHGTGAVRGLLCARCNTGIGGLRDDPATVDAAAAYLRKWGK
jgi:hypothetical protein